MITRSLLKTVAAGLVALGLSACTFVWDKNANDVTGPVGGSVVGSQRAANNRDGAALGALLERVNGKGASVHLNDKDRQLMGTMAFIVLDQEADGNVRTWRNKLTKNHGSFSAQTTWNTSDNLQCRRFINMIIVKDTESRGSGTACRQDDRTWAVAG
jgi:surface antigen